MRWSTASSWRSTRDRKTLHFDAFAACMRSVNAPVPFGIAARADLDTATTARIPVRTRMPTVKPQIGPCRVTRTKTFVVLGRWAYNRPLHHEITTMDVPPVRMVRPPERRSGRT